MRRQGTLDPWIKRLVKAVKMAKLPKGSKRARARDKRKAFKTKWRKRRVQNQRKLREKAQLALKPSVAGSDLDTPRKAKAVPGKQSDK